MSVPAQPSLEEAFPGFEGEQLQAVAEMSAALGSFSQAITSLGEAGVPVVDALAACGVSVPIWARPLVNSLLPPA